MKLCEGAPMLTSPSPTKVTIILHLAFPIPFLLVVPTPN